MELRKEKRWMEQRDDWKLLRGKAKRLIVPEKRRVIERWYNNFAHDNQRRAFRKIIRNMFEWNRNNPNFVLPKDYREPSLHQAIILFQNYCAHVVTEEHAQPIMKWLYHCNPKEKDEFRDAFIAVNAALNRDMPQSQTKTAFPHFEPAQYRKIGATQDTATIFAGRNGMIKRIMEERKQAKRTQQQTQAEPGSPIPEEIESEASTPLMDVASIRDAIAMRRLDATMHTNPDGTKEPKAEPITITQKAHESSEPGGPLAHMLIYAGGATTIPTSVDHFRNFSHFVKERRRAELIAMREADAKAGVKPGTHAAQAATGHSNPCNPKFTASACNMVPPVVCTPKLMHLTSKTVRKKHNLPMIMFE